MQINPPTEYELRMIESLRNQENTIEVLKKRIKFLETYIEKLEAELDEGNGIGLP